MLPDLRDPGCMASVFRYTDPADGEKSRILFSGPQSERSRENGTVLLSYDEGLTWPVQRVLYKEQLRVLLPDRASGRNHRMPLRSRRGPPDRFRSVHTGLADRRQGSWRDVQSGNWKPLPPLPDKEGFAGPFAGVSHGALLVAGGANFPEKKPWEGGKKVWYDTIFALDRPDGQWSVAGKLPRPLGYGVSVTHRDGVVCVGGSDADRHYADAFRLECTAGKVVSTPLPPLPRPVANACGALVGDTLYVAGGQERPDATETLKTVYRIDLAAEQPAWQEIEAWPGGGRMLAVAASYDGAFWLAGGTDLVVGKDGKAERRYLKDAYRYDPGRGWKRVADLPRPVVAAPSPAPADGSGFFILGGDDGSKVGFTPPERHPGFEQNDPPLRPEDDNVDRGRRTAGPAGHRPAGAVEQRCGSYRAAKCVRGSARPRCGRSRSGEFMNVKAVPSDTPGIMRAAWLAVALLAPVALLNYLDRQMLAAMKSSMMSDIPDIASRENWGFMLGSFKWVYAFLSPIGGYIADRISRRHVIVASLFVWSAVTWSTGYVTTYSELVATRALMGISEAFYIPAALALIADFHRGSTQSRAVGIHQMGIYAGIILGGFAGHVADHPDLGWRFAFQTCGVVGVVYALPLAHAAPRSAASGELPERSGRPR